MTAETTHEKSTRGGCLDAFIKLSTFGVFGVETTIKYEDREPTLSQKIYPKARFLRPSNSIYKDGSIEVTGFRRRIIKK
ncbi:hypothetical protein A3A76_05175 [Candidatus Woesebacteria bacterium RIFCSPLOWO2_01_FULL_39_23]|uniref:Uncharacterized protein n=3 Tax=Microgenomates group TaxID=1794810 RepID=A0A0H4TC24_9BACT|nr:hypothetical protein [uncultured Microgenomates bacterium Rifle_16ft_4_minimus_37633]AKQ05551.1 hypothetical protein [uncultured Microgenomates bacterium Rifle_16ft_4_minimus_24053]OGM13873.1 MAG: hypothetical protein A2141_04400 [Candidatus Woesebacteria bacterium RBG_16_40_11]OGM27825.1 MAG: hypothetical protein A2628_05395 [Candidatus Woesebacteria bacterium RIFCSPHIGHO2_01_FULL_40_22]OGM36065.1 MAG: hypothetical protein A3E41_04500 [Candidatus Woesebacteria bacterium RIFCSPHIGHO2_12_FULL